MTTKRLLPVLLVALAFVGACADQTSDPTGVPQFEFVSDSATLPLTPVRLLQPAIENVSYAYVDGNGGRVVDDVNGHEIKIMPKTVSEGTWFVMHTLSGDNIIVDLTAWRKIKDQWIQVTTFDADGVRLRLSYANAEVEPANRLHVSYLPQDSISGPLEPMTTEIDKTNKQAQARLSHFSNYTMAMD
ncbi:MAG TPA: hypothetical protein VGD49_12425 [Longimicrobiales bacterium]